MSQTRVRAEILVADGAIYGELYERLMIGGILAVFPLVSFKDTRDPGFPGYQKLIKNTLNTFLLQFKDGVRAVEAFTGTKELHARFLQLYVSKHPHIFPAGSSLHIHHELLEIIKEIKKCYPAFFECIVVLANQDLFEDVMRQQETFDTLVLVLGSRETEALDNIKSRSYLTNSFYTDLKTIMRIFKEKLPGKNVEPCLISLPDVYENTIDPSWGMGQNLLAIFKDEKPSYKIYQSKKTNLSDPSMLTLTYLVTHHLLDRYPNAQHTHCLRSGDRAEELSEFYKKNANLLPYEVQLVVMHYENKPLASWGMQGSGFYDSNYFSNVAKMMQIAKAGERADEAAKASSAAPKTEEPFSVLKYLDIKQFKSILDRQRATYTVDQYSPMRTSPTN